MPSAFSNCLAFWKLTAKAMSSSILASNSCFASGLGACILDFPLLAIVIARGVLRYSVRWDGTPERLEIHAGRAAGSANRAGFGFKNEDHAGAGVSASESEPAVQSERSCGHGGDRRGDHGNRRRWFQGYAGTMRGPADRPESATYRAPLAGHVACLLLCSWPRENARAWRIGLSAVGHPGQNLEPARARDS